MIIALDYILFSWRCFRSYKKNVVKNDCLKAKILETIKNANIQCGYSEFTIL